ncbi:MAG TPA: hypothetical protein VN861_03200 [Candidatus Acidoferrales bacterium]|nr:hypothetical protein [Candidatus Acidoferrales bacterium]
MAYNDFPVITSNAKIGLGIYGTVDPWVANSNSPFPNGAQNPPGAIFILPPPNENTINLSGGGYGEYTMVRYVKYLSTANPAVVAGPAPVYYTDNTFTTVSGVSTESVGGVNFAAGWMAPNSGTSTTYGLGTTLFTNTILNNGGNGSYVFIILQGFVPGAVSATSVVAGDYLIGAATNFTTARSAAGTAPPNTPMGVAITAVSGGFSDVKAVLIP